MIDEEPRVDFINDQSSQRMHIGRIHLRSEVEDLLRSQNLWNFYGNILLLSPLTAHRMLMTREGGLQVINGFDFAQHFEDMTKRKTKKNRETWAFGGNYVIVPDAIAYTSSPVDVITSSIRG